MFQGYRNIVWSPILHALAHNFSQTYGSKWCCPVCHHWIPNKKWRFWKIPKVSLVLIVLKFYCILLAYNSRNICCHSPGSHKSEISLLRQKLKWGCIPSEGVRADRICALSLPASGGCQHSLAFGHITVIFATILNFLLLGVSDFPLPFSFELLGWYLASTRIIQSNLVIAKPLT